MPVEEECPPCPEGAPGWIVTYGDMVTLILTFFVLLFTIADVSQAKFALVLGSIQDAFGQGHNIPTFDDPVRTQEYFEQIILMSPLREDDAGKRSRQQDVSGEPETPRLPSDVRPMVEVDFEFMKCLLSPEAKGMLRKFVESELRTQTSQEIIIQGHVSTKEAEAQNYRPDTAVSVEVFDRERGVFTTKTFPCADGRTLSYWRAYAALQFLRHDAQVRAMLPGMPDGLREGLFQMRAMDRFDVPQQAFAHSDTGTAAQVELQKTQRRVQVIIGTGRVAPAGR